MESGSSGGANVDIINCTFEGNKATAGRAGACGFYTTSTLVRHKLINCTFTDNSASNEGGALRIYGNFGPIYNCTFTDNSAGIDGGAIFKQSGNGVLSITLCNFTNNSASDTGGAIYKSAGALNLTDSNFDNNSATNGGAIRDGGLEDLIANCNFTNNSAAKIGGAIYDTQKNVAVINSTFTDNTAGTTGGAVHLNNQNSLVINSTFIDNTAGTTGGAVQLANTYSGVENSIFIGNTAGTNGGALYQTTLRYDPSATINGITYSVSRNNTNFTDNVAGANGGALYIAGAYGNSLTNYNFINNTAVNGGAVATAMTGSSQTVTFEDCNFTNNTATGFGGAIYRSSAGRLTLTNVNLTHNRAGSVITLDKNGTNVTGYLVGNNGELNAFYTTTNGMFTYTHVKYWNGTEYVTESKEGYNPDAKKVTDLVNATVNITVFTPTETRLNTSKITNESAEVNYDFGGTNYTGARVLFLFDGNECYLNSADSGIVEGYGDFYILQKYIDDQIASEVTNIVLPRNFTYTVGVDTITDGINISANNVVIDGKGVTLDAQGMSRIFNITGANVTVKNITLVNGNVSGNGGAIYWNGANGTLEGTFINDTATNNGGAVYWSGANGTLTDTEFVNNSAANGAAVYWTGMNGTVLKSEFVNNIASYAALVVNNRDIFNINDTLFLNNTANAVGGAIYFTAANEWNISNCTFTENKGYTYSTGAVFTRGNGTITNSKFIDNFATASGSALYVDAGIVNLKNSNFTNNTCGDNIVLVNTNGNLTIENCNFTDNNATYDIHNYGNLNLTNNTLTNLIYDQGIIVSPTTVTILENSTVYANIDGTVNITAIIYDDNNNIMQVNGFKFVLEDGTTLTPVFDMDKGIYTTSYVCSARGTYTINVTTDGMSDCTVLTGTIVINDPLLINVTVEDIDYLENATVIITLGEVTTGNVTITIVGANNYTAEYIVNLDDYDFTKEYISPIVDSDGNNIIVRVPINYLEYNITGLNASDYTVSVKFNGNSEWATSSNSTNFTVHKIDSVIDIDVDNIKYGENATVIVTLPPTATGNITVYVAGKNYTTTGGNSIIVSDLNAGGYDVVVLYNGDNNYNANISFTSFNVSPLDTTLTVTAEPIFEGEIAVINVTLVDSEENNINAIVIVNVNGINYTASVSDGKGSVSVSGLTEGEYTVTAFYNGDVNYINSTNSTQLTVTAKNNISINVSDVIINVGETATVNVNVTEAINDQNITITVNGKKQTVTVKDGKASADFTDLAVGKYDIIVEYAGDETYNANSANATLTVNKINTDLIHLKK